MNLDRIKSTIRAMLNLAANEAATQGEKDNAMRKVSALMDEHNLREEDLADADGVLDSLDNVEVGKAVVNVGARTCYWMATLCIFVQNLLGTVKSYTVKSTDRKSMTCVFYGVLADCQIAAEIYYETRDFIETACGTKYGGTRRGDGYSYCVGFVSGLNEQLAKIKAASAPPISNALVVARNAIVVKKHDIAKRWADDQGLKLRSHTRRTHISGDPFADGLHDGSRYNVNLDRRKKITA